MFPDQATRAKLAAGSIPPTQPVPPRREQLDQGRGLGPVQGCGRHHEDHQYAEHHWQVYPLGIGFRGIAGFQQGGLESGLDSGPRGLQRRRVQAPTLDRGNLDTADPDHGDGARRGLDIAVRDARVGQHALGDVAGTGEGGLADRVELQGAGGGVGHDDDW